MIDDRYEVVMIDDRYEVVMIDGDVGCLVMDGCEVVMDGVGDRCMHVSAD